MVTFFFQTQLIPKVTLIMSCFFVLSKKIGELNETNMTLKERIDLFQMEKVRCAIPTNAKGNGVDYWSGNCICVRFLGYAFGDSESTTLAKNLPDRTQNGLDSVHFYCTHL